MNPSRVYQIFGLLMAVCIGCLPVAATANDFAILHADLSLAWQQGRSKYIADRFDEALAAYRRAAELAPDAIEVHWATWSLLDRLGAQDQALTAILFLYYSSVSKLENTC